MQDFFNFINNFRNNLNQWATDLDRATNQAINNAGRATNQAWQAGTAPFRALGDAIGNSLSAPFRGTTVQKQTVDTAPAPTNASATVAPQTQTQEEDATTYTYQAGDTFGDVIRKLGLESGNGLWGENGDVRYYTDQLAEQGFLDRNGNIPVGTTIKLRRRK